MLFLECYQFVCLASSFDKIESWLQANNLPYLFEYYDDNNSVFFEFYGTKDIYNRFIMFSDSFDNLTFDD